MPSFLCEKVHLVILRVDSRTLQTRLQINGGVLVAPLDEPAYAGVEAVASMQRQRGKQCSLTSHILIKILKTKKIIEINLQGLLLTCQVLCLHFLSINTY